MRVREQNTSDDPVDLSLHRDYGVDTQNGFYYPGTMNWTSTVIPASIIPVARTKLMKDVVIPEFYRRSALGQIFNNPMESNAVIETHLPGKVDVRYRRTACSYDQSDWSQHYTDYVDSRHYGDASVDWLCAGSSAGSGYLPIDPLEFGAVKDIAVSEAWRRISHSEILVLAALAESGKTVTDLTKLLGTVYKIFHTLYLRSPRDLKKLGKSGKRVKFSDVKKAYSEIEDLYMNARYNLRPLYYDICGILELFESKQKQDRYTFRGYASKTESDELSESYWHQYLPHGGGNFDTYCNGDLKLKLLKKSTATVDARAGVLTKLDDLTIWKRMGIDAIPETMWELVPFSFILDWFANFGSTILAWAPKYGSTVLASWVTVTSSVIQSVSVELDQVSSGTPPSPWAFPHAWDTFDNAEVSKAMKVKTTTNVTRIPDPVRSLTPHIEVNLDLLKITDLAIICKNILTARGNIPLRSA
jgi:hypothetical protein